MGQPTIDCTHRLALPIRVSWSYIRLHSQWQIALQKYSAFFKKQAALALGVGVVVGAGVGAVMSIVDWRLNPGGVFRDSQGTNWDVVVETALSWFFPVALASFVVATIGLFLLRRSG